MDDTFTGADLTSAMSSGGDTSSAETTSAAESVATADTTAPPGAATTAPAEGSATSPSTDKPAGPIPFDVHKTALENARLKAVEEWKTKYGWAEQVNEADIREAVRIAQLAQKDPIAYVKEFIKDLQTHATYGPQLKSLAAQALAQRAQQAEQEPQPDLPIQLEDGRVVHLYSAEQQAKREAFLQKQWLQSVEQKLQPLQQTHEQLQARAAALQQQQAVDHFVTTTYADVQTWEGMQDKANQVAVAEALKAMKVNSDDPREVSIALNTAYRQAVLPKLLGAKAQAVLTTTNAKVDAGSIGNPAQTTVNAPAPLKDLSWGDALRREYARVSG